MNKRFWISLTGVAVSILVLLLFPVPSAAQTATGRGETSNLSSPDGGNPYLSGVWQNERDGSCNMEDVNSPACGVGAEGGGQRQPRPAQSRIVDPPDGKIPYLPWARAQQQEVLKNFKNPKIDQIDLQSRCLPGGVPRPFVHSPYQFVQIPGYVVVLHENFHLYRVIPLDGRPHVGKDVTLWMGDSRGRWEGNTLVVDVTNLNGRMWFDVVGNFHSDALHLVERFTVVNPDTISYEATFEDPAVYSRPWKMAMTLKREEPGVELMEWACHEGERDAKHILR